MYMLLKLIPFARSIIQKKQKEYFINQNVIEHIITKAANENFTGSELIPIVRSIGSVFKIVKTNNEYR